MTPREALLLLPASAFLVGLLLIVGAAIGVGLSVWVAGKIVKWLERKGLLP